MNHAAYPLSGLLQRPGERAEHLSTAQHCLGSLVMASATASPVAYTSDKHTSNIWLLYGPVQVQNKATNATGKHHNFLPDSATDHSVHFNHLKLLAESHLCSTLFHKVQVS